MPRPDSIPRHEPTEQPLAKPPADYRDPSEFKGASGEISLEKLTEESAVQKALDEAKKRDASPEAAWVREREAEVDDLFNELTGLESMSDTEALIRSRTSTGKESITDRLQRRLEESKKVGDPTAFLAVTSEVLRRFKDMGGIKELGGGKVTIDTGKTNRFYEQTAALEQFMKEHALGSMRPKTEANEADEVWTSSPPPQETREASPPPESLPGGVKFKGGMGVRIE
ncbi:MAG: hypothetical protein AAB579_02710 [Patescibacteria group bacterium]